MEEAVGIAAACRILSKSRSTVHRQRNPKPAAPKERKEFRHPAELTEDEKNKILAELNSPRFADKAVAQVYTTLLDEGRYLASEPAMHRLLRENRSSGDRRAQASHPAKKKPELLATGPNGVWSWDITKLRGPARGVWYLLYVIMDIYSRKVVHWEIWPAETGELAADFIRHAIAANGGIRPEPVHADRGTSMTSNTVSGLYAKLNIAQSHSRPHVSNDNPYSESAFKTLKYCPAFPGRFGSIQDANVFCGAFFTYYNHQHRHSGIAMHTPRLRPPRHLGHRPGQPRPDAPRGLREAPGPVPRPLPQAQDHARQGLDQRAARHHRGQPTTSTNTASSLMSHSV